MSYMTGHMFFCNHCDYYGKMKGFDNAEGDFIHECPKCKKSWIAMSTSEQEEAVEERMNEAMQDFNNLNGQ